jgi:hypothetical protein
LAYLCQLPFCDSNNERDKPWVRKAVVTGSELKRNEKRGKVVHKNVLAGNFFGGRRREFFDQW